MRAHASKSRAPHQPRQAKRHQLACRFEPPWSAARSARASFSSRALTAMTAACASRSIRIASSPRAPPARRHPLLVRVQHHHHRLRLRARRARLRLRRARLCRDDLGRRLFLRLPQRTLELFELLLPLPDLCFKMTLRGCDRLAHISHG